jgi:hypothetical protein
LPSSEAIRAASSASLRPFSGSSPEWAAIFEFENEFGRTRARAQHRVAGNAALTLIARSLSRAGSWMRSRQPGERTSSLRFRITSMLA